MDFGDPTTLNAMLQQTIFQKERMIPTHKRLWLLALDLFPPMIQAWVAERQQKDFLATHQALARQAMPEEVKNLLEWILHVRTIDRDWIVFFDGRFKQARKPWDAACDKANLDPGLLETIVVAYNNYAEKDFRSPSRRLGYCSNKIEMVYMAMPNLKRSGLAARPRSEYNQCGEESSFENQYTGADMRALSEMPFLQPEDLPPQSTLVIYFPTNRAHLRRVLLTHHASPPPCPPAQGTPKLPNQQQHQTCVSIHDATNVMPSCQYCNFTNSANNNGVSSPHQYQHGARIPTMHRVVVAQTGSLNSASPSCKYCIPSLQIMQSP